MFSILVLKHSCSWIGVNCPKHESNFLECFLIWDCKLSIFLDKCKIISWSALISFVLSPHSWIICVIKSSFSCLLDRDVTWPWSKSVADTLVVAPALDFFSNLKFENWLLWGIFKFSVEVGNGRLSRFDELMRGWASGEADLILRLTFAWTNS